ncbi:hypothetical protein KP509_08G013900 [Ceratopteris richardii]|uniref:Adenylate cyclase regulatory protein n=1 Tax=Ceratopteris richardii TaxID=49495 RepID=A0A8T2U3Q9_CERRI|nr:hypothetical protein KP509_08G013900 [Ceratopteris richardii]
MYDARTGLSSLQVLKLDGCTSLATLTSLPTTLKSLNFRMSISENGSLETGSLESVEDASLPNLRDLAITRCPKLKRLALHATSLERLDLSECAGLVDLACIGNPTSLEIMDLRGCEGLEDLDCKGLSSLRVLKLDGCTVSSLPTTVESLSYNTGSLESVEDILQASLPNLRSLTIAYCPKLKRLALHETSLEKLDLEGCAGLEDLDCKGLSSLRFLSLDLCTSLATLSSLPTTLQSLSLRMYYAIGSLESVEDASLPNLRDLTITRCPKLKRLALHATSLEKLDLTGCEGLEDLDCKGTIFTLL